uniref:Phage-type lysozyme 2 n=1 Tax=Mercenaria mercenaria TaxID=6596 RepID=A0AAU8BWC5_MERMC
MKVLFTCFILFGLALAVYSYQCGLTSSDVSSIKGQLRIDEGYKDHIYRDSEGYLTFGIGHLITHSDPEYGKPAGTQVSTSRIDSAFATDFGNAVTTTHSIFHDCSQWPSEVKRIIVNMAFNLGGRIRNFHKFIAAVNGRHWNPAANEMMDSQW